MKVSEYLQLSREERTKHVNLSTPCEVDESVSRTTRARRGRKALLEELGLEDDLGNWTKAKANLCHLCESHSANGWCTNPTHLYVGTNAENSLDVSVEVRKEVARKAGTKSVEHGFGFRAPGQATQAGRNGGLQSRKLRRGWFDPKHGKSRLEAARRGGRNGSSETKVRAGTVSAEQRWVSLVDGFLGRAQHVAKHNQSVGEDPTARVQLKGELLALLEKASEFSFVTLEGRRRTGLRVPLKALEKLKRQTG